MGDKSGKRPFAGSKIWHKTQIKVQKINFTASHLLHTQRSGFLSLAEALFIALVPRDRPKKHTLTRNAVKM